MNAARELLRVAKFLMGGLFQPPPLMVVEISQWMNGQIAADRIAILQRNIEATRKVYEDDIEQVQKQLDEYQEEIKEWMSYLRQSKRKPKIRQWSRVKRKFSLNFKAWRYFDTIKNGPKYQIAMNWFDPLTVELVNGDLRSGAANYNPQKNIIHVSIPLKIDELSSTLEDLKQILRHELLHFAQAFMKIALETKTIPGEPSKKIKTPEVRQKLMRVKTPEAQKLVRRLKRQGITPDAFHSLDDIEFYTDLADTVESFRRGIEWLEDKLGRPLSNEEKKTLAGFFASAQTSSQSENELIEQFDIEEGDEEGVRNLLLYLALMRKRMIFFKDLKLQRGQGKWKKAVKEFFKAVLE